MGSFGAAELLIIAIPGLLVFGVVFLSGFFVGKSVGFKQGLRERRRP
jgi:hypothetical protein